MKRGNCIASAMTIAEANNTENPAAGASQQWASISLLANTRRRALLMEQMNVWWQIKQVEITMPIWELRLTSELGR